MTILIACTNKNPQPWLRALHKADSHLDIDIWPREKNPEAVEFALCWKHPTGILQNYPNLKCVCSMGAGVDHLLEDSLLPKHLPIIRLVDPQLAQSMFEYLSSAVMLHMCNFAVYEKQQQNSHWQQHSTRRFNETTIGVMGLGKLGEYCAKKFTDLGFNVVGWSRSEKSLANITAYHGNDELPLFLRQSNILICLLPLTKNTSGILNRDLFNTLPKNAFLINVARGQHLIENDLLEALHNEQLKGACLDVFNEEPLVSDHPFWQHEKIRITPHCSSITDPNSVALQIIENYRLMKMQQPLLNQVDLARGY